MVHRLLQVEHQPVRPARTKKLAVASSQQSIDSILTEMEREILHTGSTAECQSQVTASQTTDEQQQPRIGGLTIQEFIHFLALLERVKEQHQVASLVPPSTLIDAVVQEETRRHSLYDNMNSHHQQQPSGYRNASTSPRTSPPPSTSRSSSASSSSSSSSSLSMSEENEFHPSPNGSAGFTMLERLFLRRYLHVIPEEALSDCGTASARISRALSGISSALSFLEEEDRRSSIIYSEDEEEEEPDYCEPDPDPATPVPVSIEEKEEEEESVYITVVALPAIVIDCDSSEDGDLPVCSDLPSVLEDFPVQEEEEEEEEEEVDESLLPLSVVQIQETTAAEQKAVVTLIDTKIVSVDYHQPISSTVLLVPPSPPSTEVRQSPPPPPADETMNQCLEGFQTPPDANSPLAPQHREDEEQMKNAAPEAFFTPSPEPMEEEEAQEQPNKVDELRRFWEQRSVISVNPPPTRERVDSIQAFRMFFEAGWPPPPPPPPPERFTLSSTVAGGGFSSETETGYSTDGSEKPFPRRRRLIPPPRPTPPREELLLYYPQPQPPLPPQRLRHESAPRSQEGGGEDEDEVIKARLLADWLSLAKRSKSTGSIPTQLGTGGSNSNYSTLNSSSISRGGGGRNEDESTLCGDTSDCDSDDWNSYRFRRIPSPPPRAGFHNQGEQLPE